MDDQNTPNLTATTDTKDVSQPKPGDVIKPDPGLSQPQPSKVSEVPSNGDVKVTDGILMETPKMEAPKMEAPKVEVLKEKVSPPASPLVAVSPEVTPKPTPAPEPKPEPEPKTEEIPSMVAQESVPAPEISVATPDTSLPPKAPEIIEIPVPMEETSSKTSNAKKAKKSKKPILMILLVILFLGAIGIGIYLFVLKPLNGEVAVVEDETPESTESMTLVEDQRPVDVTSLKYLENQFKDQDKLVEELVKDTNFKESINIDSTNQSEFK